MTVKKAIEILEKYYAVKNEVKMNIQDPSKTWNSANDLPKKVAGMIADSFEVDLIVLDGVLKQIKDDCKHPKKMIDTINGQKYCMNCNLDL